MTIVMRNTIRGIGREIDVRTWKIAQLIYRIVGRPNAYVKPCRRRLPLINEALRLHREVQKLKLIRADLYEKYDRKKERRGPTQNPSSGRKEYNAQPGAGEIRNKPTGGIYPSSTCQWYGYSYRTQD